MTLNKCFNCALALMIGLSLAMANVKAEDDLAEEVNPEYSISMHYGFTSQESIFVSALNEYRVSRGLHPVAVCSDLSGDCRSWSSQMRQRGRLSHDPRGGTEICAQISRECGINALQIWQRSPAHNAILLSPRIDTIGIGSDGNWWTMRGRQGGERHTVFRPTERYPTEFRPADVQTSEIEIPGFRTPGLRTSSSPAPVARAVDSRVPDSRVPDSRTSAASPAADDEIPGSRVPGLRPPDARR